MTKAINILPPSLISCNVSQQSVFGRLTSHINQHFRFILSIAHNGCWGVPVVCTQIPTHRSLAPVLATPAPMARAYAPNIPAPAPNARTQAPYIPTPAPMACCYAPIIGAVAAATRITIPFIRTPKNLFTLPPITLIIYSLTIKNTHYENLC